MIFTIEADYQIAKVDLSTNPSLHNKDHRINLRSQTTIKDRLRQVNSHKTTHRWWIPSTWLIVLWEEQLKTKANKEAKHSSRLGDRCSINSDWQTFSQITRMTVFLVSSLDSLSHKWTLKWAKFLVNSRHNLANKPSQCLDYSTSTKISLGITSPKTLGPHIWTISSTK